MAQLANDYHQYPTIVFIDANVVLEGKPLPSQPWSEIDPCGPILILLVPQVLQEIDRRKRDSRLSKRARDFNRLIEPAALSCNPERIVDGNPSVFIAIPACDKIDWGSLDDLDDSEPDARIVAQMLNVRGASFDRCLFLSHDINPISMASRRQLKVRKLPQHWLLEPEPSPAEKELNRLKARLSELEVSEPLLEISLRFDFEGPGKAYRVRPLSTQEQERLTKEVVGRNPKPAQRRSSLSPAFPYGDYDASLDRRYENYVERAVPRYAASLHETLEGLFNQFPFTFSLSNKGNIQAEHLVIELRAVGGTLHDKFVCEPVFGPGAPKVREKSLFPSFVPLGTQLERIAPVPRHEMEFVVGPNKSHRIEIHCGDFRQGREWSLEGIATVASRRNSPFKIIAQVTASNMHGTLTSLAEFACEIVTVDASELADQEKQEWLAKFPMQDRLKKELEVKNYDWLDHEEDQYDDEYEDE